MKDVISEAKCKNPNNKHKPIHFSDYFKIDKQKLKEIGTFDPIINFDTPLFVEPLLLVKSSSDIIANAKHTYDKYFSLIFKLLYNSKQIGDKAWQGARRLVHSKASCKEHYQQHSRDIKRGF